jgi:hypothetical protein
MMARCTAESFSTGLHGGNGGIGFVLVPRSIFAEVDVSTFEVVDVSTF